MGKMRFYFDEMIPRPVANELIQRGHEATMAVDVGMEEQPDPLHLAYAAERRLILVTQDKPFAETHTPESVAGQVFWLK